MPAPAPAASDVVATAVPEFVYALPHVNASLNALATVLLVTGYVLIRRRRETAHKWAMIGCFSVSVLFLTSYVVYHSYAGSVPFPRDTPLLVRGFYFFVLITHIVLAAAVPFLAIGSVYTGWRDQRRRHKRLSVWTFPIWLYVSVTGVIVYAMLYHLYAPA